eukprot:4695896-Alexandrium_andersonii.AAC.1
MDSQERGRHGRGPTEAPHAAHHAEETLRGRHCGCGCAARRAHALYVAGCQAGWVLPWEYLG